MKNQKTPPRLNEKERAKYWRFFDKILTTAPSQPEEDYVVLCDAWKEACGADWIWLWLLDSSLGTRDVLQLVGTSNNAPLPNEFRVENCRSVVTYCVRTQEPISVENPGDGNWGPKYNDEAYTVRFSSLLKTLGCTRVVCVPLLLPLSKAGGTTDDTLVHPNITGGVCIYYKSAVPKIPNLNNDALKMMGLLSTQAILNSYHSLQRNILLELNQVAHNRLTTGKRPPRETCKLYVSDVIGIIKRYLRVEGVSIFYRDTLRGGVQCLDSTGLVRVAENEAVIPIKDYAIADVNYQPGKGATGRCYQTGKPEFLVEGMKGRHKPQTAESIEERSALELPAVIYPIPMAKGAEKDVSGNQALGVIRCKYHHAEFTAKDGLCFDAIEVQTLDFIARQIAPVLETFEANISREAVVSITKHDLLAPLDFIRHRALHPRYIKEGDPEAEFVTINRYDIYDFGICALLSLNLVRQFDADPSIVGDAEPELVKIESRIIAPLKNMLVHYARITSQMSIRFENLEIIPNLWLDEILTQRAFFNLFTNAVKYGKKKTEIRVVGRKSQAGYNIDVINEGIGVDTDEEQLIFRAGYRSPRVRHIRIGLGLGLTIARACIEKCGGKLYLVARKNPTVFSVFFPNELTRKPQQIEKRL